MVVVTVYEDRSYCYQALDAGATDFLLSPVDHVEFRARARNLLTLRKQQKLLEQRAYDLRRELTSSSEQHEAALRASELRLRRLIDTVPATISAVDRAGRLTLINTAHRQIYGIDPVAASVGPWSRSTARSRRPGSSCSTPRCSRPARPCRASSRR